MAEEEASLIGSITGWRLAIDTFNWIFPTTLPLNSVMAFSADSPLSNVTNPQFYKRNTQLLYIVVSVTFLVTPSPFARSRWPDSSVAFL